MGTWALIPHLLHYTSLKPSPDHFSLRLHDFVTTTLFQYTHCETPLIPTQFLTCLFFNVFRVKELTVDPNQVMEGGRPNIHAVNQLDILDEEWLSISPQRDDLKLLCEQNVRTEDALSENIQFGCSVNVLDKIGSRNNVLSKRVVGRRGVSPALHLP